MQAFRTVVGILPCSGLGVSAAFDQPSPPPDPDRIQVLIVTGQHVHDWRGTTLIPKQRLLYLVSSNMGNRRIPGRCSGSNPAE